MFFVIGFGSGEKGRREGICNLECVCVCVYAKKELSSNY